MSPRFVCAVRGSCPPRIERQRAMYAASELLLRSTSAYKERNNYHKFAAIGTKSSAWIRILVYRFYIFRVLIAHSAAIQHLLMKILSRLFSTISSSRRIAIVPKIVKYQIFFQLPLLPINEFVPILPTRFITLHIYEINMGHVNCQLYTQ